MTEVSSWQQLCVCLCCTLKCLFPSGCTKKRNQFHNLGHSGANSTHSFKWKLREGGEEFYSWGLMCQKPAEFFPPGPVHSVLVTCPAGSHFSEQEVQTVICSFIHWVNVHSRLNPNSNQHAEYSKHIQALNTKICMVSVEQDSVIHIYIHNYYPYYLYSIPNYPYKLKRERLLSVSYRCRAGVSNVE